MGKNSKQHKMRIADRSGDTTVTWDVDSKAQVQDAQKQFETLINKHYQAFAFRDGGNQGEVATTFDPEVKKYVIMPQAVGG